MGNLYSEKFLVIFFLLSFALLPSALSGSESHKEAESNSPNKAEMILTIEEELISLDAKDVSLKEIIEEIGSKMKVEVVGSIACEEMITLKFDMLSIEDALRKLSTSYGYVMDSETEEEKITKIIVLPKGNEAVSHIPTTKEHESKKQSKRPEPFKFEFDPSEFMKEEN